MNSAIYFRDSFNKGAHGLEQAFNRHVQPVASTPALPPTVKQPAYIAVRPSRATVAASGFKAIAASPAQPAEEGDNINYQQ
ncbi:MAG: hypothetical protein LBH04_06495 [Tannerellaceae bacterium]|jgi:hypothetical protein|nr:hypothetical protein [Tannerellaceae bacterium]